MVHADTRLAGVDLLGGMIHLDSILTTSDYQANDHGTDKHVDNVLAVLRGDPPLTPVF